MDYRIVTLEPVACLREGWAIVRDRYWLLLAITVTGLIIGSLAPLGVLMGPMVCGIYICLFKRLKKEEIAFRDLFRGMDYFVQSLIATLVQLVPIMAMTIPVNLLLALQFVKRVYTWMGGPYRELADMMGPREMFVIVAIASVVVFLLSVFFGTFFMFSYPLIVDRKMRGWDAVKLSARASRDNFRGAAVLMATTTLVSLLGSLVCYVGAFLVTPVTLAAWVVAYRRVFPELAR
ncbi:MAG TPA: hypothetical protein PLF26_13895 [Blastocatellia bacterium]|nr:hypothetical protein [Blastocatellia bacterium]